MRSANNELFSHRVVLNQSHPTGTNKSSNLKLIGKARQSYYGILVSTLKLGVEIQKAGALQLTPRLKLQLIYWVGKLGFLQSQSVQQVN